VKKIIVLNIGLFLSIVVFGQASPSSKIIDASMPAGTSMLTNDQMSQYMKSNFKRNGIPIDNKYLDVTNYYKKEGLIISFWDFETDTSYRISLEGIGAGILGLLKRNKDTVNLYRIVKINDIKFLEYEYQQDNEIFLRFQSDANAKNQNICGLIQCKKPDERIAQSYLQELLQSMHFKE
jgi:hypothetical protein